MGRIPQDIRDSYERAIACLDFLAAVRRLAESLPEDPTSSVISRCITFAELAEKLEIRESALQSLLKKGLPNHHSWRGTMFHTHEVNRWLIENGYADPPDTRLSEHCSLLATVVISEFERVSGHSSPFASEDALHDIVIGSLDQSNPKLTAHERAFGVLGHVTAILGAAGVWYGRDADDLGRLEPEWLVESTLGDYRKELKRLSESHPDALRAEIRAETLLAAETRRRNMPGQSAKADSAAASKRRELEGDFVDAFVKGELTRHHGFNVANEHPISRYDAIQQKVIVVNICESSPGWKPSQVKGYVSQSFSRLFQREGSRDGSGFREYKRLCSSKMPLLHWFLGRIESPRYFGSASLDGQEAQCCDEKLTS